MKERGDDLEKIAHSVADSTQSYLTHADMSFTFIDISNQRLACEMLLWNLEGGGCLIYVFIHQL